MKLQIIYKDYVRCQVIGLTPEDRSKAYEHFSVFIPTARFMPSYKIGQFDGYKRFFSLTGLFYVNLLDELYSILDMSKYEVEETYNDSLIKDDFEFNNIDETFLSDYIWYNGHRLEGQPVELMDHQVDIVNACLNNHRCIIEASTSAGKTLCALALARIISNYGRFIIIEPSKDLTLQTANVFKSLGFTDVGVCGCGIRELDKKVTICTWQTINSLNKRRKSVDLDDDKRELSAEELKQLINGTVGLLYDEVHTAKSHEISKIMETIFKDVPVRWGLTGTVPKAKSDYYSVLTALGKVVHHLESKELQDKGILAKCNINIIRMEDDLQFRTYMDEIEYLSTNINRLKFIGNLIHNVTQTSGNSLILVNRIKTGEFLEEFINSLGTNAIYIDGSVNSKTRFKEYESIKTENNKCIIATSAIASTGLDIPRIFNLIFMDYPASFVRTIQSIGRGLRLGKDKNEVNIFDICSTTPFSRKHLNTRIHYYHEKQFPMKVLDVNTWK